MIACMRTLLRFGKSRSGACEISHLSRTAEQALYTSPAVVSTLAPGYIVGDPNLPLALEFGHFSADGNGAVLFAGLSSSFRLSQGLARGRLASTGASCGILAANAVYFLLSAISIAAELIGSRNAFSLITWVGAAHTLWLGVRTFMGAGTGLSLAFSAASPVSSALSFGDSWYSACTARWRHSSVSLLFKPRFVKVLNRLAALRLLIAALALAKSRL
jgi:threonine/homoserine/homoserine lactone efflux protein